MRWHDHRHFYASASASASAGIPMERAANDTGHADISTVYKHHLYLFGDDSTDDMDRLVPVARRPALARVRKIG